MIPGYFSAWEYLDFILINSHHKLEIMKGYDQKSNDSRGNLTSKNHNSSLRGPLGEFWILHSQYGVLHEGFFSQIFLEIFIFFHSTRPC